MQFYQITFLNNIGMSYFNRPFVSDYHLIVIVTRKAEIAGSTQTKLRSLKAPLWCPVFGWVVYNSFPYLLSSAGFAHITASEYSPIRSVCSIGNNKHCPARY